MNESEELCSGYAIPDDPEPALRKPGTLRDEAISELWKNLYHQGDVGPASCAAGAGYCCLPIK